MRAEAWANGLLQTRSALFSDDGMYRYCLSIRQFSPHHRMLNFLMLNPSTATERVNDPTVERCERRAWAMGYDEVIVTNLFAFRATDPAVMLAAADPVGDNDRWILGIARNADKVICAWGTHGNHRGRAAEVLAMLRGGGCADKLHYLTLCQDGNPGHPLYVPYETKPVLWTAA